MKIENPYSCATLTVLWGCYKEKEDDGENASYIVRVNRHKQREEPKYIPYEVTVFHFGTKKGDIFRSLHEMVDINLKEAETCGALGHHIGWNNYSFVSYSQFNGFFTSEEEAKIQCDKLNRSVNV
ncbi:MAG: hypothetical protein ACRDBG_10010 [Waterburya sp.]